MGSGWSHLIPFVGLWNDRASAWQSGMTAIDCSKAWNRVLVEEHPFERRKKQGNQSHPSGSELCFQWKGLQRGVSEQLSTCPWLVMGTHYSYGSKESRA